jgi:hypothetical protein
MEDLSKVLAKKVETAKEKNNRDVKPSPQNVPSRSKFEAFKSNLTRSKDLFKKVKAGNSDKIPKPSSDARKTKLNDYRAYARKMNQQRTPTVHKSKNMVKVQKPPAPTPPRRGK